MLHIRDRDWGGVADERRELSELQIRLSSAMLF